MVTRSDKSSTKLRIVYNTIAKGKNGVGLNDCLYKGPYEPNVVQLPPIVAITANIEKSHLQISVEERHRNLLHFLGFDSPFEKTPSIVKMRFYCYF